MATTKKGDNIAGADLAVLQKARQLFLVKPLSEQILLGGGNTHWEEVKCVGYNPYHERLEAVVSVKQATGYSGNLCSNGSQEYVRFFVDFHDGAGFRDMGLTSFKVADISDLPPGAQHPLSYTAFVYINDARFRRFLDCDHAVIPTVRAVLSWQAVPSSNPNIAPHYGNHIDADIQLARRPYIRWADIAAVTKVKEVTKLIDPEMEIAVKNPTVVQTADIIEAYHKAEVPAHRTFLTALGAKMNTTHDFSKATGLLEVNNYDKYKINVDSIYDFLNNPSTGNTTFEELTCVGLNTLTDRLGAIIHIKRPSGYLGNLCHTGSQEHVAFWADWNNDGTFDQYLGTVSLNVHDIANITPGGLYYNVELPIDVTQRLRGCGNPYIVRIRAVLSWEVLPSTTSSSVSPFWGNHKDALVQLRPAFIKGTGSIHAVIHTVGGGEVQYIDSGTFLFNNTAISNPEYNNRPWGGLITFSGIIDRGGFGGTIKYRILVKAHSAATYVPVSTSETFRLDNLLDVAPPYDDPQTDPAGWYIYKQNPNIGIYNIDNRLATWDSRPFADGDYDIRLEYTDEFNNVIAPGPGPDACNFTIKICNLGMTVSPTANTSVDMAYSLDLVIDGGDCHSYTPGEPTIHGHLRAVHPYFALWGLVLEPASHTHGTAPSPSSGVIPAISDTGEGNATWSLDTSVLDPCGYTVSLSARTRVILNSDIGNLPYYGPKAVGFAKLP